jgi:hypothetical protein
MVLSLADTLVMVPLLSRESEAAGPIVAATSNADDIIPAPLLLPLSLFLATGSY